MLKKFAVALVATSVTAVAPMAAAYAMSPESAPRASTTSELSRNLTDARIKESSGLARSTYARSILWTHNDSGSSTQVYAIAKDGSTRATYTLTGATSKDWEDITSGPDHKIWVGDVGNNLKKRAYVTVYRFTEPKTLADASVPVERFDLAYPDGKFNSEAIMVHPVTGRLYIVTKSPDGGGIYEAPETLSTTAVNRLTRLGDAPIKVTAASFTPDGSRFVLCNYSTAWIYSSFAGPDAQFDKPSLRQGESLEVNRPGNAIFMGSEGSQSPVYKVSMPSY